VRRPLGIGAALVVLAGAVFALSARGDADSEAFKACAPRTPVGCERYLQLFGENGRQLARADDIYFGSLQGLPVELEWYPVLLPHGRHLGEVRGAVREAMEPVVGAYIARTAGVLGERRAAIAAWRRALEALRDEGKASVGVVFEGADASSASLMLGQVEAALRSVAPVFRLGERAPVTLRVQPGAAWTVTVLVQGAQPFTVQCPPEKLAEAFGLQ
jgi:hypothetical protein